MLEIVVKELDGYPILNLGENVMREGVILKFEGKMPTEQNAHLRIYVRTEEEMAERAANKLGEPPTIPGHPNCHVGDCYECHNVACAIYQGYEEAE